MTDRSRHWQPITQTDVMKPSCWPCSAGSGTVRRQRCSLASVGRQFGRYQAAGEPGASGRGWGRQGPCPCLPGLWEKLCRQVKEMQEEGSRPHGGGKDDLWALCGGAAEMRGCGLSGSTQSQVLETLTGQNVQREPCTT